ncbi:MAG: polysaccharide biosynthesis protein [Ruminococcaceae bacterium]|nr:polysaccharide biosynthesis protein [Oscillospiraceae bacterium]
MDVLGFICAYSLTIMIGTETLKGFLITAKVFAIPFALSVMAFLVIAALNGIYRIMWRYGSFKDGIQLFEAAIMGCLVGIIIFLGYEIYVMPRMFDGYRFASGHVKFAVCFTFLEACAIVFIRAFAFVLYRYIRYTKTRGDGDTKRMLIVGAGYSATVMIHDLNRNINLHYEIIGLVDDNKAKHNQIISGYRVIGDRNDIVRICKDYRVDEILIAMPSATATQRKEIIEICNHTNCKIKTLPSIDQMLVNGKYKMRDIAIEDLLERDEISLSVGQISEYVEDKTILITGGGGSIGSELCRQIMKFNPGRLVILDIYENNAYDIQMELCEKYPKNKPEVIIASVRDVERLETIFDEYKPDVVFHAAAHKHVPLMENSPMEAIKNNVVGTYNVAKCSDKFGVKRFVMISTDKAVNPTNIMGATKRMCEMIVEAMQHNSKTEFVSVRFGNVLNSNGSVVPLFRKQVEKGGPVTITHKEITRFFMTIPEAAQLVIQAGAFAKGGEIFVLDMGEPVKIYDLAKNIIKLSGYRPEIDIEIKEIGLRPGEKLYEELLMSEERLKSTQHSKIFIGKQIDVSLETVEENIEKLVRAADSQDKDLIRKTLHEAVPTFKEPQEVNPATAMAH